VGEVLNGDGATLRAGRSTWDRIVNDIKPRGTGTAPVERYDRLSRFLHWSVAAGIIYTLLVGYALHLLSNHRVHDFLSELNMSIGTVIGALMIVRTVWHFFRPRVPHPEHLHSTQRTAAQVAHAVLYGLIFCVLISGFLMLKQSFALFGMVELPRLVQDEGLNDLFFTGHRISCIALTGMLVLHLAAVFKHQKIDKYPILSRMT
jgi:cytochrome b561